MAALEICTNSACPRSLLTIICNLLIARVLTRKGIAMKNATINRLAFIAFVVAFASHATVVHCIITDSKTGSPIDSVKAVFSFNYQPQQPVYTDSTGSFFTQAPFDGLTNIQLTLSRPRYGEKVMNYGSHMTVPDTFTISTTLVQSSLAAVQWLPNQQRVAMGNGAGPSYNVNGRRASNVLGEGISGTRQGELASQVIINARPRVHLLTGPK